MASPVNIGSFQDNFCADSPAERPPKPLAASKRHSAAHHQQIFSQSLEFVASPGRAAGIQTEIPVAMGHAFSNTKGFLGCIVLVSEQEARLVTVITLWTGSNRLALCNDASQRLHKWLSPYVDRWLRTRTYSSFVAAPQHFLAENSLPEQDPLTTTHLQ